MVSFWPFKGDDTSAESFEKALSQLSIKITKAGAQTDRFRQKQRRYKVLWTLYSAFAYILVAAILTLVTGWETWGPVEYSAVAGGPVLIYGVRTALDAYYNYRLSKSQAYLNDLIKQREAKIEKLKAATKYNSTQKLLDKYGGTPKPPPATPHQRKKQTEQKPQGPRTGFAPPPTANIARPGQTPMTPQGPPGQGPPPTGMPSPPQSGMEPTEEFAPNAFPMSARPLPIRQQSTQYAQEGPKWYDRILDVVLGDDETQAKNRVALICQQCKLVNGQAPPGANTPEQIGRWRCSSCQAWNGVESEEKKILQQISAAQADAPSPSSPLSPETPVRSTSTTPPQAVEDEEDDEEQDEEPTEGTEDSPATSTRSKARERKKA